jgi:hypothetical protein
VLSCVVSLPTAAGASARIAAAPTSAGAGTSVAVQGSGFAKGQRGTLALDRVGSVTFRAANNGSFQVSFPIPTSTAPGSHTLAALSTKGAALASTAVQVVATGVPFVAACGTALCVGGQRWSLFGASQYGGFADPTGRAAMAGAAHLNLLRLGNFLDEGGAAATAPYDGARWSQLDAAIAAAQADGLRVILDLSTYRNLLWNAGLDPYGQDWATFVAFAADRTNTVTGVRYGDDPTIALLSFAGEIEPLNTPANTGGITTQEVTDFFSRTLAQWRAHDGRHLLSPGGLSQLDWDSGIDWRAIFGLSGTDVCSIHDYSVGDQVVTTPAVASYCAAIGKPWITEEFGWPQSISDAERAANYTTMYALQRTYGAAGVAFWNLGPELVGTAGVTATYDVNPSTPATWSAVVANAP